MGVVLLKVKIRIRMGLLSYLLYWVETDFEVKGLDNCFEFVRPRLGSSRRSVHTHHPPFESNHRLQRDCSCSA